LKSLDMRPEFVTAGIRVLKEELARIHKEEYAEESEGVEEVSEHTHSNRVFLFTGYKVCNGDDEGCFPCEMEENVTTEINRLLDKFEVGPDDLAITAGMAAGGDLLFIEACAARNIPVATHMPLAEAAYVRDYVSPAHGTWVERFYKMRNHPQVIEHYQIELVGSPKPGDDVFERNNRWALYSAMVRGIDNLRLVALYDDKRGNGHEAVDSYLVKHLIDLMRDAGGQVEFINPSKMVSVGLEVVLPKKRTARTKKKKAQEVEELQPTE
jgi:hypothetical protein